MAATLSTVDGWTGTGTLTGLATDTVEATKNGNFTLTDTSLTETGDTMSLILSGLGFADLDRQWRQRAHVHHHRLDRRRLAEHRECSDTVVDSESADFTLSDGELSSDLHRRRRAAGRNDRLDAHWDGQFGRTPQRASQHFHGGWLDGARDADRPGDRPRLRRRKTATSLSRTPRRRIRET